jgi:hypothetical protein
MERKKGRKEIEAIPAERNGCNGCNNMDELAGSRVPGPREFSPPLSSPLDGQHELQFWKKRHSERGMDAARIFHVMYVLCCACGDYYC